MENECECENCRFWRDLKDDGGEGECHAHAPKKSHDWPRTYCVEWCGEWQPAKVIQTMELQQVK